MKRDLGNGRAPRSYGRDRSKNLRQARAGKRLQKHGSGQTRVKGRGQESAEEFARGRSRQIAERTNCWPKPVAYDQLGNTRRERKSAGGRRRRRRAKRSR